MKLKRGAYELNGKIFCDGCYFKNIKEESITFIESVKHMICVDDVHEKFGLHKDEVKWDARCEDCGGLIEYDLSNV